MRIWRLPMVGLLAAVFALSTSCGGGGGDEARADGCADVLADQKDIALEIDALSEQLEAAGPRPEAVYVGRKWWSGSTFDDSAGEAYDASQAAIREQAQSKLRVLVRLTVNNPDCFDARQVAEAQELLAHFDDLIGQQ